MNANAPEIARTMRLFVAPGQLGEVRIIQRTGGTLGFFFAFDQIDIAAKQAANFDTAKAKGLYLVMNEIDPATLNGRGCLSIQKGDLTKDIDIRCRRWVLIDFDPASPDRGADDSATDAEKASWVSQLNGGSVASSVHGRRSCGPSLSAVAESFGVASEAGHRSRRQDAR